jgi:hypothetical protein
MSQSFPKKTKTALAELSSVGYVRVTIDKDTTQVLSDAVENLGAAIEACGTKKRPLLVDLRLALPIDPEARRYYSGRILVEHFLGLAMIVDISPVGKMMANVYLRVAKPQIPTKIFTDEEEATEWLKLFMN